MTDYTDWTRTPIRFEDVKAGDVIEGEENPDSDGWPIIGTLSPTLVEHGPGESNYSQIELAVCGGIVLYGARSDNWTLRKLTPPTPQWPDMAPLTALGQMAEGTIKGKPARILVIATWLTAEPAYSVVPYQQAGAWNDSTLYSSWSKVLDHFDPGSLHPITAEPVVLTDEQVRMLPKDTWLINGGDEWCTANSAWTFMEDAPYTLIHYPKEK